ncbi:hypothetical protein SDC9_114114 [bioreactor metagenome]|uniref:Uncharacterized protein n=1 Tax=bioreactor metagenome TaxID=1076179 RepID=A0A645BPL3_9ZZZZ
MAGGAHLGDVQRQRSGRGDRRADAALGRDRAGGTVQPYVHRTRAAAGEQTQRGQRRDHGPSV